MLLFQKTPSIVLSIFISALLNSRFLDWFYKLLFEAIAIRGGYIEFREYLIHLPIRCISFTTPAANRKKLEKQGENIYEADLRNNDTSSILGFADKQLEANRMDAIHDLLALLADRMIGYNKIKYETAKRFHADLKDFHNIDIHTLTPKTRLDEFWKLEITEVFEHLKKNKKIITGAGLNISIDDEDKIRNRFISAKNAILPVGRNIEFTDNLIDQIVYRLYGLTNDEIKIVEESL